jgi:hypothetical protein
MPTPTRRPNRPAVVVPFVSPADRHRSSASAAARRHHPSSRPLGTGDAVIIPFPIRPAPPGRTP